MSVLHTIGHGFRDAFLMAWEVWWALVLGFAISAVVQAWVPRERIERSLGGSGARPVALATALGAVSSSCSYAAVAIAKSLFEKGASAAAALAFQFSSTNLVFELGIVLWVLIGWQFTLAEFVGGLVLIAVMTVLVRLAISSREEGRAREHVAHAEHAGGHDHSQHGGGHDHSHQGHGGHRNDDGAPAALRERVRSIEDWREVAGRFRADWAMVWKEVAVGFLLAGFIGQINNAFFRSLFLEHAPAAVKLVENAIVGPVIAVLSFVCSVGNVPLAAVLWSGGISFAGVIAFIFADLIVLPIVQIYRKYYGSAFALRIVALMFASMVIAALIVDGLFGAAGLIPHARPTRADVFGHVRVDYKLFANALAACVFGALFALTLRTRAGEPADAERSAV